MCLKRLKLPESIVERLLHTLPKEMVPVLIWVLKKPNPWVINIGNYLQKKIIRDYKLNQEIISAIRGIPIYLYTHFFLNYILNFYILRIFFILDDASDESNSESFGNKNNIDEYLDKSDSDVEYISKKKCNRKKIKLKEKINNNKTTKKKFKIEMCKDVQSYDIRRVTSLHSINTEIYNSVETKGILI